RRTGESQLEEGLNETLRRTLRTQDLLDLPRLEEAQLDSKTDVEIHKFIKEVVAVHAHLIRGERRSGDPAEIIREIRLTPDALLVKSTLDGVGQTLSTMAAAQPAAHEKLPLDEWVGRIAGAADEVGAAASANPPEIAISKENREI